MATPSKQGTLDSFLKKSEESRPQKIRGAEGPAAGGRGPTRHRGSGHVRHSPLTSRPEGRVAHETEGGACGGATHSDTPREQKHSQTKPSLQPEQGSLRFSEVRGDLFSCPDTASMAHCVSEDMHMGKGIAMLFKKKFGGVDILKSLG